MAGMLNERIKRELETIRHANGGILKAEAVVEYARNKRTALHSRFTWDDTKAAEEYRIYQARNLIRVTVSVLEGHDKPHPIYVSIDRDREQSGGGYRLLTDVMSDEEMRTELLQRALKDASEFQRKYSELRELAEVFAAIKKVTKRRKTG